MSANKIDVHGLPALIASLQSMRDRMIDALHPKFGDGFDGDMDTLLEASNALKRIAALRQSGEAVEYEVSYVSPLNFGGFCIQIASKTKLAIGTKLYTAPPATSGLVEAAGLVADLASTEWQEPDGSRKGATDNFGKRMYFVSAELIDGLRAALAAHDKRGGE